MIKKSNISVDWDLSKIYPTKDEWLSAINNLTSLLSDIKKYQNKLSNKQSIKDCQDLYSTLGRNFEKIFLYSSLRYNLNTKDQESIRDYSHSKNILTEFSQTVSFINPELAKLDTAFLEELAQDPDLVDYKQMFREIILQKPHILDEEKERMLAAAGQIFGLPSGVFGTLTNADMKFPDILDADGEKRELTEGTYGNYMESGDRTLRKNSYETLLSTYGNYENVISMTYIGNLNKDKFFSKERGYNSSIEKSLHGDNIPQEILNVLIRETNEHLDLLHKFNKLKGERLKLAGELQPYDLSTSIISADKADEKEYSYQEAVEIVLAALAPLGKEYTDNLEALYRLGTVDVYEKPNKRSGAFQTGVYDTTPFMLLNFHGRLKDVLTLAHESGHAMHTFFSNRNQPYSAANYTIFLAEIASTVNELLVCDYLLGRADENTKKVLIYRLLETIRGTVFNQVMYSEFELAAHRAIGENKPMAAENLHQIWGDLIKKYNGPSVQEHSLAPKGWMRIPHFYSSFYVYKYATGITSAFSIFNSIKKDSNFVKEYIKFLSNGGSQFNLETLAIAKVNLREKNTYRDLFNYFDGLVESLR